MAERRRSRRVRPYIHASRGVWNPELKWIRWYPKTEEAFVKRQQINRERFLKWKAEGRLPNRRGVPNGFAGSREELEAGRAKARAEAKEIIAKMKKIHGEAFEDPRGEEALEAGIEVVRSKATDPLTGKQDYLYPVTERLKAAKMVLEWTKAKPAAKSEVTIARAEDFLEGLVQEPSADI